jgi:hypothetical protein
MRESPKPFGPIEGKVLDEALAGALEYARMNLANMS